MNTDNKLQTIMKEQDLDKSQTNVLLEAFGAPFEEAGVILDNYKTIKVTDEKQTAEMKEARQMRLALKKTRVEVEHKRKDLKADIIKQGRAIDKVARFVKEVIEPAEDYLEQQEKFAEIKQAERAAAKRAERVEELSLYTDNVNQYRFDDMSDEEFDELIDRLDAEKKAKIEADRIAEEKRIADEKAEAEQREKERKENERLKAEAAERDKKLAEANEKAAEEAAARKRIEDAQAEKERQEQAQKAKEAEAKRQAELAPDKEKLMAFADQLESWTNENLPNVDSDEALILLEKVDTGLNEWAERIKKAAEQL